MCLLMHALKGGARAHVHVCPSVGTAASVRMNRVNKLQLRRDVRRAHHSVPGTAVRSAPPWHRDLPRYANIADSGCFITPWQFDTGAFFRPSVINARRGSRVLPPTRPHTTTTQTLEVCR